MLLPDDCQCTDWGGPCPPCVARAESLIGQTIRDSNGRVWTVADTGSKDGNATLDGDAEHPFWTYLFDTELVG